MKPTQRPPPELTLPSAKSAPLFSWSSSSDSTQFPSVPSRLPLNFSDLERLCQIGSGSSDGTVYKVLHRPTGKLYALRVFHGYQKDSVRHQIRREIVRLRDLDNPNVVKCYDMFYDAGEIHVLLEYMDGGSLEGTHIIHEPFLADLTRQVLSGLSYLHSRKLVHRYLKPSNLLCSSKEEVKVSYFGLFTMGLRNSSSIDSIAYMSPERINTDLNHDMYDGYMGDIWSLGLIILEFYLGIFPFGVGREADWASLMTAICLSQPPEAPPRASREFQHFIACCLQSDPLKRWTAEQLLRHPFILQSTSGSNRNYEDFGQKWSSLSSLSPSRWTVKQNRKFEHALQLFGEDSPDRWQKVAVAVGGGKSVEDVVRHYRMLVGDVIKIESGQVPMPSYTAKPQHSITKVLTVSKGDFRQKVLEFTSVNMRETPPSNEGEKMSLKETMEQPKMEEGKRISYVARVEEDPTDVVQYADLEFENLPEYLRRCILYCSLFSLGYEFEKDTLVQLWIAQGLIAAEVTDKLENVGTVYFNILVCDEFILPSRFDNLVGQMKYKMNESMAFYREKRYSVGDYLRVEEGKLGDTSKIPLHLSLLSEDFDPTTSEALKNCKHLRSLLLLREYGSSIKKIPRDLFLSLKVLRTLDLSRTHISELPSSIGNLASLRYLDLSETPIKRLPESIDCLYNLQTLKLKGCFSLFGLPKCMKKLISLRHLDLDIVRQLESMPTGMGNLTCLQTLRAFLVGREDGCRIGELKNMNNISGSFCISRLENVLNAEEAREAALSNKQYLSKLELRWGDLRDDKAQAEEQILECLWPHSSLKELQILFYNGSMLPSWISNPSFADIVSLTLYKCKNCHLLPSIGELPSLMFLNVVEMNRVRDINRLFCRNRGNRGYHAFPKLEKLTLDVMLNLEEWTGVENGDFPCLLQCCIKYCPKLFALPLLSHLNSLKHLELSHCAELQSLPEERLPASLESLIVTDCPTIKERCCRVEGEDWFKIAHVPSIWMDHQEISLN